MRAGIWLVLALIVLVVGAGIFAFAVLGITPATIANASVRPAVSGQSSDTGSAMIAPPAERSDTLEQVSASDANEEVATFASSIQDHQCDRDTSASAGY